MRSGSLRHRIDIQVQTPTNDGMGGQSLSWASVSGMSTVPASVWPLSSNERLESMKKELEVTHKIRIRYRSGITSKNRIVFGSRVFDIISFLNVSEKNRYIDILALEKV
jgi:SPP1 family predicted phage head-tail adaptor